MAPPRRFFIFELEPYFCPICELTKISGKVVPDDRISLQAETPHASRNSDGHAAIFDKKLFIVLSFHEETCEWTSERSGARGRSNWRVACEQVNSANGWMRGWASSPFLTFVKSFKAFTLLTSVMGWNWNFFTTLFECLQVSLRKSDLTYPQMKKAKKIFQN